jgi:D-alanine-D-alanine ligase
MKVAILYNAVADSDSASDRDVLVQVQAIEQALCTLGHVPRRIACTLNLEAVEESLTMDRPGVVFNLVESLGGSDRLAHLAAVLLDDLDLPYTGTHSANLHLTNNKPAAKERLRSAGLPTADWAAGAACAAGRDTLPPPYIIKAVWEHASVGLDDHAIIRSGDGSMVAEQIESRSRQLGRQCFAEQFIEGREFNLSLIANGHAPHVLPPAEIDFTAFPKGKPRIVGYAAKWDEQAFEYDQTPRKFDFPAADAPLLDTLRGLALDCWRLFDLRGYARVDYRVDAQGRPWILEINANPCLSPDAGFAAALARARLPYERAVEWILEDAHRRPGHPSGGPAPREEFRTLSSFSGHITRSVMATMAAKLPRGTTLRTTVLPTDTAAVRRIVESTGLFRPGEIDVAVELVQAFLDKGPASGYEFVFAEQIGEVVAYACFGRNSLTVQSWDVYWIAVEKSLQGQGLGRVLLEHVQQHIAQAGGGRVYIETSHRADYQATRGFYERCGYTLEAVLADFYAPGDSKAIYVGQVSNLP